MHRWTRVLTPLAAGCLALVGCGGGENDIGQAAEKSKATRVVEVRLSDNSRIEPALIPVKPSETVTLQITNTGKRIHEFHMGDKEAQEERAEDMKGMGTAPMNMADKPNSVTLDPGATEEITWTFPKQGGVLYGCHQPGEYDKGRKGEVKVSE